MCVIISMLSINDCVASSNYYNLTITAPFVVLNLTEDCEWIFHTIYGCNLNFLSKIKKSYFVTFISYFFFLLNQKANTQLVLAATFCNIVVFGVIYTFAMLKQNTSIYITVTNIKIIITQSYFPWIIWKMKKKNYEIL